MFDESTVEAFTIGDCWALALEVRTLTGYPLVFSSPDPWDGEDDHDIYWTHVGVSLPDGRILDVNGPHNGDEWLALWCSEWDVEIANDTLITALTSNSFRSYPEYDTRQIAQQLIRTYLET